MERIRDALEKVRQQRENDADIGAPQRQTGLNVHSRGVADPSAIQHPTVSLDAGHLERNRGAALYARQARL